MLDIPNSERYIGRALTSLPNELAEQARELGYRPTIKCIPALDKKKPRYHEIATYQTVPQHDRRARLFNLPGGGVKAGEPWITALNRELHQELIDVRVTTIQLQRAPILALAAVPSSRKRFHSKLLVVVGLLLPQQQFTDTRLAAKGVEIRTVQIGSICAAATRLHDLVDTNQAAAQIYRKAFTQLRIHLTR